jgi:hypothetical protein
VKKGNSERKKERKGNSKNKRRMDGEAKKVLVGKEKTKTAQPVARAYRGRRAVWM